VPGGRTSFADLVHGSIDFDNANIEDFVVLRSDAQPTYHLSVVVDDIDMEITHVVRGDDHISNTPKQVLIYEAFGRRPPAFAHVPLILGPDKKRLSKRHGATSVMEYHRLGYLPEAMVNFLALLGWSPGGDQELFSKDDLVERFTLEGISGGNAVFNPEKLDWFNQQHLLRLETSDLARRVEPGLREQGLWQDDYSGARQDWFYALLDLFKSRVKKLDQFGLEARPLLSDDVQYDEAAVMKHLKRSELRAPLEDLISAWDTLEQFLAGLLEQRLRETADRHHVKAASLIHATRVAVTGRATSPGLFEVLELVGRDRVLQRLRHALLFIPV
jgi:glutamyl-tRNA synthetase